MNDVIVICLPSCSRALFHTTTNPPTSQQLAFILPIERWLADDAACVFSPLTLPPRASASSPAASSPRVPPLLPAVPLPRCLHLAAASPLPPGGRFHTTSLSDLLEFILPVYPPPPQYTKLPTCVCVTPNLWPSPRPVPHHCLFSRATATAAIMMSKRSNRPVKLTA